MKGRKREQRLGGKSSLQSRGTKNVTKGTEMWSQEGGGGQVNTAAGLRETKRAE